MTYTRISVSDAPRCPLCLRYAWAKNEKGVFQCPQEHHFAPAVKLNAESLNSGNSLDS